MKSFNRQEPFPWRFDVDSLTDQLDATARSAVIQRLATMTRSLLEAGVLSGARTDWIGAGSQCLPVLPIVGMRSQLVVTDEARVAQDYDWPEAFWDAWDSTQAFGNRRLLLRAAAAATGEQFLEQSLDGHWAMVRAAKGGRTEFTLPQPTETEHPIYRRGSRAMQTVGYHPQEQCLELACGIQPGKHVNGWEIFDLWSALAEGKLPDGRSLRAAHVVFLERTVAEQEKRPLLDVGARVFYQDSSTGEDVELSE